MEKLNSLVKDGQKFSSEYKIGDLAGVSSHLPMCLFARFKIGATDDQLIWFYDKYTPRLEPKNNDLSEIVWKEQLGKHEFNSEYVKFFASELQKLGLKGVLQKHLPLLFKGVGGGAFHPLIRLGYAIEMDNESEVIEALASWAMGHLPLNIANIQQEGNTVEILNNLSAFGFDTSNYQTSGVYKRMLNASFDPSFQENLRLPEDISLPSLAESAVRIFLARPSFACIHLVTATHALRQVLPFLGEPNEALRDFWLAFTATYVSEGAPKLMESSGVKNRAWEELFKQAVESENDHWCKFTYTCHEEEKHYGSSIYLDAANLLLSK